MKHLEIQATIRIRNTADFRTGLVVNQNFETEEEAMTVFEQWLERPIHRRQFDEAHIYDIEMKNVHGLNVRIIKNQIDIFPTR